MAGGLDAMQYAEIQKSSDGTLTVSCAGLPGDCEGFSGFSLGGFSFEVVSHGNMNQVLHNLTFISKESNYGYVKATESAIYKTIPLSLYESYQKSIVPKEIAPDLSGTGAKIKIRTSKDPWLNSGEGWTVQDVLNDIWPGGIGIPGSLNYSVNEVQVNAGVPIVSVIRSLCPIPGLQIGFDGSSITATTKFLGSATPPGAQCWQTDETKRSNQYSNIVVGGNSFPIKVTGGDSIVGVGDMDVFSGTSMTTSGSGGGSGGGGTMTSVRGSAQIQVHVNKVGGLFGVHTEDTSGWSAEKFIDAMFV